jgi:hypothetical protein
MFGPALAVSYNAIINYLNNPNEANSYATEQYAKQFLKITKNSDIEGLLRVIRTGKGKPRKKVTKNKNTKDYSSELIIKFDKIAKDMGIL